MTLLNYKAGLWTTDPQILLSQVVYHFSNVTVERESDERFRFAFLPPLSFLYTGVMQAMGYSLLSPNLKTIVVLTQGQQSGDYIVPSSGSTVPFLGKSFSIPQDLINKLKKNLGKNTDLMHDDDTISNQESFWHHIPFIRVGCGVDSILPVILPKDVESLESIHDFLLALAKDSDDVGVIFSSHLSITDDKESVRKLDKKNLASSMLGKAGKKSGIHLFDIYSSLAHSLQLIPSHLYYDDSQSVGYENDTARGLLVSGY